MDWIGLHKLGSLCHPDESMKTYTTMKQSIIQSYGGKSGIGSHTVMSGRFTDREYNTIGFQSPKVRQQTS